MHFSITFLKITLPTLGLMISLLSTIGPLPVFQPDFFFQNGSSNSSFLFSIQILISNSQQQQRGSLQAAAFFHNSQMIFFQHYHWVNGPTYTCVQRSVAPFLKLIDSVSSESQLELSQGSTTTCVGEIFIWKEDLYQTLGGNLFILFIIY